MRSINLEEISSPIFADLDKKYRGSKKKSKIPQLMSSLSPRISHFWLCLE